VFIISYKAANITLLGLHVEHYTSPHHKQFLFKAREAKPLPNEKAFSNDN